ncbi:MAG: hypothetical protein LBT44_09965 [Clostridiales bacterium]|jgi:hypothetical protein|nr:hypothetical protein [Clostridiales bacterium]
MQKPKFDFYRKQKWVKPAVIISAAAIGLALLSRGTYALDLALKEGLTSADAAGVWLRDDFDGERKNHVYVENSSPDTIYVRARVDEYMEMDGESLLHDGAVKEDVSTWKTHVPDTSAGHCDHALHHYWAWNLGGAEDDIYYRSDDTPDSDAKVSSDFYTEGDLAKFPDLQPLPFSYAIMMSEWNQEPGSYWVFDSDGWAYWAQPLEPDEATGLLIKDIEKIRLPEDDYYYGINVVMQAATLEDLDHFSIMDGGISAGGENLLGIISTNPSA